MTLELLLVRHAESEGNQQRAFAGHGPSPLTPRGRAQAEALAQALAGEAMDEVHCSDLVRARQTLEPILRGRALTPEYTPALRERDLGALTGRTFAEVEAQDPEAWHALKHRTPHWRPSGGESHEDCAARMTAFCQRLEARRRSGRVLLVSHRVALDHLLRHLVGASPEVLFAVDNASLHRIERRARGTSLVLGLNLTQHLQGG